MSLVFDDVSFSYDDAHVALSHISLSIEPGDFLGVIGHTGSGKSTFAQLMNALLVPTEGRVLVEGLDTATRALRRQIRERVGLVFQYPENQLFANTVAEDVAFGPNNLGLEPDDVEARCREALALVDMPYDDVKDYSPFDLSGGQRRRVALAGVLAMRPDVLVLDEPAAGMDPRTVGSIRAYLRALNERGMTIVLISHSMDEVAQLCNRVLVLEGGEVLLAGTPASVFTRENAALLRTVNLGLPRAAKFALELADKGLTLDELPLTPEQLTQGLVSAFERKAAHV